MSDLCDLTATELASKLAGGEISAVELADSCLARIDAVEDRVRAFLTLTPEVAR